ncbi:hypothetical protein EJF18_60100 [Clavispora lusitaniae]|uniref:Uncharacterized protein n=1 Tax=Clavispora lusitaniae TaxID=36911 RepID=A0ACD0WQN1_CLALS|nr:hypothetical protein EJF14_60100 [Clavispora lusitaniae]QFZ35240.1 hypothetical protein EJF16_60100 [Clavispora lusitaniae]QFZ40934.1 hypothetical protein EJF15_60100 [Clavispora lusitaniae]QFZ46615.1 hypothetical protein EJF18_60100 [Clavispora lusitaniae]QFZ52280.1 hypothetical protein EJF17_60100 [Clavispora lusitaniae]
MVVSQCHASRASGDSDNVHKRAALRIFTSTGYKSRIVSLRHGTHAHTRVKREETRFRRSGRVSVDAVCGDNKKSAPHVVGLDHVGAVRRYAGHYRAARVRCQQTAHHDKAIQHGRTDTIPAEGHGGGHQNGKREQTRRRSARVDDIVARVDDGGGVRSGACGASAAQQRRQVERHGAHKQSGVAVQVEQVGVARGVAVEEVGRRAARRKHIVEVALGHVVARGRRRRAEKAHGLSDQAVEAVARAPKHVQVDGGDLAAIQGGAAGVAVAAAAVCSQTAVFVIAASLCVLDIEAAFFRDRVVIGVVSFAVASAFVSLGIFIVVLSLVFLVFCLVFLVFCLVFLALSLLLLGLYLHIRFRLFLSLSLELADPERSLLVEEPQGIDLRRQSVDPAPHLQLLQVGDDFEPLQVGELRRQVADHPRKRVIGQSCSWSGQSALRRIFSVRSGLHGRERCWCWPNIRSRAHTGHDRLTLSS